MLNRRSLDVLRHIVEAFVETGEPIGSLSIVERLGQQLSSATIRNIMAQMEEAGLLYSPHTSAGRLPTDAGLRFFVNGILESTHLLEEDQKTIEQECRDKGLDFNDVLNQVTTLLSGLSSCMGLVITQKNERAVKHIEFITIEPGHGLAIIVMEDGSIENRLIQLPKGVPSSVLMEASNYLNARLSGKTLDESRAKILQELDTHRSDLDTLAAHIARSGIGLWSTDHKDANLIVRGQSNLLRQVEHMRDLGTIQNIFSLLDRKETLIKLLEASMKGEGIQIFIGAENEWFHHVGCSLVLSPYKSANGKIVGAIGVIGPTRINYSRIIPMVDYTAKIMSQLIK